MKLFKKLFYKQSEKSRKQDSKDKELNAEKKPLAVKFQITSIMVGDYPFRLMINMSLLDFNERSNYSWFWTITLKSFKNDARGMPEDDESKSLMKCMKSIISEILKENEIQVIGTSTHKGIHDIMFYAKAEDTKQIGGKISEMPETLEDQEGRFMNFKGNEDPDWASVQGYYSVFNK